MQQNIFKATLFDLVVKWLACPSKKEFDPQAWVLYVCCWLILPVNVWVPSRFSSVHAVGVNTSVGVCLSLYCICDRLETFTGCTPPWSCVSHQPYSIVNEWIIWFIRPLEGITTICKHNEDDTKGDNAFTRHSPIYFMHLSGFWLKWDSKD